MKRWRAKNPGYMRDYRRRNLEREKERERMRYAHKIRLTAENRELTEHDPQSLFA